MKIIAKADGDNFILQATGEEIANLCGYNSRGSLPTGGLTPGSDIKVSELWLKVKYLTDNKNILLTTADKLREVSNHLEVMNPIVEDALVSNPRLQPSTRAIRMDD